MWNVCAWTNDPDVKVQVPIVTLYAIMFKGHDSYWMDHGQELAQYSVFTLHNSQQLKIIGHAPVA